jgi:hypothetical protein
MCRITVPLLLCGLLMLHDTARAQTVIFQDSFDNQTLGLAITSLNNWTVTAGNVDVIGPGFFDLYPGNGHYLDMDGSCGNATIQSPPLNLAPGVYQLSFRIGNNSFGGNSLNVSLGSLFNQSFVAQSSLELTPVRVEILVGATTMASLVLEETGPSDCGGSVLDSVTLTFDRALAVFEPFAAFKAEIEIEPDEIELKTFFRLGETSDGIQPKAEAVTLAVGTFEVTIPAGSFRDDGNGRVRARVHVDGVEFDARIRRENGGFEFRVDLPGDLAAQLGPGIQVSLTIGNDRGTATARVETD